MFFSPITPAQNNIERLGLAAANHFGTAVFLNILADSNCKNQIMINSNLDNQQIVRKEIMSKL